VGDLTGTTPLFSIIQDSTVELQAKVPETLLPKVVPGSSALITSDSDRRIRLQGVVREINPTIDAKTRQALVKINLPQSDLLKPGMFLRAVIAYDTAQALTISAGAVISQPDGKNIVYVLGPNNTAKARTVLLGDPSKGRMVIKEGLSVGDRVIVSGAGFVKDGDRVNVVP
jgi:HlyD family secretion protein